MARLQDSELDFTFDRQAWAFRCYRYNEENAPEALDAFVEKDDLLAAIRAVAYTIDAMAQLAAQRYVEDDPDYLARAKETKDPLFRLQEESMARYRYQEEFGPMLADAPLSLDTEALMWMRLEEARKRYDQFYDEYDEEDEELDLDYWERAVGRPPKPLADEPIAENA